MFYFKAYLSLNFDERQNQDRAVLSCLVFLTATFSLTDMFEYTAIEQSQRLVTLETCGLSFYNKTAPETPFPQSTFDLSRSVSYLKVVLVNIEASIKKESRTCIYLYQSII